MSVQYDLRYALQRLSQQENELIDSDTLTDPDSELAGVYRYIGAGGTLKRPTKTGPAMMFTNIKGYPDAKVLIGLLAKRERTAFLLDTTS